MVFFEGLAGLLFVLLGTILYKFFKSAQPGCGVWVKRLLTEYATGLIIGNGEGPTSISGFDGIGARRLPKRAPGVPANRGKRFSDEKGSSGKARGVALCLVVFQKRMRPSSGLR